jgi:hypothetical protein
MEVETEGILSQKAVRNAINDKRIANYRLERTMKKEARAVLYAAGIAVGNDFNSLGLSELTAFAADAEVTYQRKYKSPLPPDRSSAYVRSRYNLVQQRAARI